MSIKNTLSRTHTHSLTHSLTQSLTRSLTHSLIHSLTHSLAHSLTLSCRAGSSRRWECSTAAPGRPSRSRTLSHTHSLTPPLTRSLTHSLTRSLTHSATNSLAHSLTHSGRAGGSRRWECSTAAPGRPSRSRPRARIGARTRAAHRRYGIRGPPSFSQGPPSFARTALFLKDRPLFASAAPGRPSRSRPRASGPAHAQHTVDMGPEDRPPFLEDRPLGENGTV